MKNKFYRYKGSLILGFLLMLIEDFSLLVKQSLFCYLLTGGGSFEKTFEKSYIYGLYLRIKRIFPTLLKARLTFAEKCEQSVVTSGLEGFYVRFFASPVRTVGIFLLTYGGTLFAFSFAKNQFLNPETIMHGHFFTAIIFICVSVIFIPVKKSIGYCISKSFFLSVFSPDVRTYSAANAQSKHKDEAIGYSTAFLTGLLCGIFSYVVSPTRLISFIAACLMCIVIFNRPESGILVITFTIPFLNTAEVLFSVVVTFIAFIYKFLRGKRHINFGYTDILLFLTSLLIFFAGAFTMTGSDGIPTAMKYIIAIMLSMLTTNLIRSTEMVNKCITMLFASSVIIAAFDVANFLYGIISRENTAFVTLLSGMRSQVVSTFASTGILGTYLAMTLPLILSLFIESSSLSGKIKYAVAFILLSMCLVYSNSMLTLTVLIIGCIIVLSVYNKLFSLLILFLPVFSQTAGRFLTILADAGYIVSPKAYSPHSIIVFKSAINVIKESFLSGIGIGDKVFSSVFPKYTVAGTEGTAYCDSLLVQLIICTGFIGAAFCIITVISLLQKTTSFLSSDFHKDKHIHAVCTGLFGGTVTFLILSIFSYTWTDSRIILLFWFYISLGNAAVKSSQNDYIDPDSVRAHLEACGTK